MGLRVWFRNDFSYLELGRTNVDRKLVSSMLLAAAVTF